MNGHVPRRGFTIVELLIVIVVIGILAALVISAFTSAQARARDASRVNGLRQIQKAVEAYYAVNESYPLPAGGSGTWSGHCPSYGNYDAYITGISAYLPKQPIDPRFDVAGQCFLYRSDGIDYMAITHGTMETVCGGDPGASCNPPDIQAMDRVSYSQLTIAVYSPGAKTW